MSPVLSAIIQADSTPGNERRAIEIAAQEMTRLGFDDLTSISTGT